MSETNDGNTTVNSDEDLPDGAQKFSFTADSGEAQQDTTPSEPEELIPENPVGAEEDDNDPEKPEFGEYPDEASPDHTEENADFDADEPELVDAPAETSQDEQL